MKKFALTLIVVGAAIGLASESFAQAAGPRPGQGAPGKPGQGGPGGPGGMRRGGGMRRMQEMQNKVFAQLKVTPAQKTKIDALNKKTQEKFQTMMKDFKPGGDRNAMREKFRGVQTEHQKGMKGILTADQFKKYEALMKAERAKMRQGRPGGAPGAGAPGSARPGGGRPGGL